MTTAAPLAENQGVGFQGIIKTGAFDIPAMLAREWLRKPLNPNGRPNSDVLHPFLNGTELTKKPPDRWIIDFGVDMSESDAALYELPFAHVAKKVKVKRVGKRESSATKKWWLHQRPRPKMRKALMGLDRCLATSRVSRHRIFIWLPTSVLPDSRLVVFASDDDTTFGILHSRFHTTWAFRKGMMHGKGNDPQYTPTEGFETFPFPDGLTPNIRPEAYAEDPRAIRIAKDSRRNHRIDGSSISG